MPVLSSEAICGSPPSSKLAHVIDGKTQITIPKKNILRQVLQVDEKQVFHGCPYQEPHKVRVVRLLITFSPARST